MTKNVIFFLIGFMLIPVLAFSQDSGCDCYLPLDTLTYKTVPFTLGTDSVVPPYYYNNVNTSHAIKLPFKFCFYGVDYDSIYIGNKGNITFVKPIFDFTTGNLPAGKDTMMIAPFWANIDNIPIGTWPPGIGEVWYKMYSTHLVINWYEAGYSTFDDDLYNSFKLIISNGSDPAIPGGNNVEFCYEIGNMQWACSDSSGGSMGFGGVPATVGINKGDKTSYAVISRFSLPGLAYYGPGSAANGLYWLDDKSLLLNTCVTEKNIPPVIINYGQCDTFSICRWDSLQCSATFLCAEQGQKATLSASAPGLGNLISDTSSNQDGIYHINVKIAISDTAAPGYHTVNITATDNSTPPQTSTYPVIVNVNVCAGINEIRDSANNFTLYPNANNGVFTISLDNIKPAEKCEMEVYDMLGKEIYAARLRDFKIEVNLSSQPRGMYFIKIYRDDVLSGVKKMVIQ